MRADAERNRHLIIASARELFTEAGIDVPVDDIAKRAGVGTGTFYRHFPTKEALIEAILIERAKLVLESAQEAAQAKDRGKALFEVLSELVSHNGRKKDLLAALATHDASFREASASVVKHLWDAIGTLLANAQKAHEVRSDVDLAALRALLSGVCVSLEIADGDRKREKQIWSVFTDGLRRK